MTLSVLETSLPMQRSHDTLAFGIWTKNWCLGVDRMGLDSAVTHRLWRTDFYILHKKCHLEDTHLWLLHENGYSPLSTSWGMPSGGYSPLSISWGMLSFGYSPLSTSWRMPSVGYSPLSTSRGWVLIFECFTRMGTYLWVLHEDGRLPLNT